MIAAGCPGPVPPAQMSGPVPALSAGSRVGGTRSLPMKVVLIVRLFAFPNSSRSLVMALTVPGSPPIQTVKVVFAPDGAAPRVSDAAAVAVVAAAVLLVAGEVVAASAGAAVAATSVAAAVVTGAVVAAGAWVAAVAG